MASAGTSAVRRASHAGSWYTDRQDELATQLTGFLKKAGDAGEVTGTPRAIIAPHAGYSYSGPTAAWAYRHLKQAVEAGSIKRVLVLGPSHHVFLDSCALPVAAYADTPVGRLTIDAEAVAALASTGKFSEMSLRVDEDEHSIEMQLPYIAHIIGDTDANLLPIMVGSINPKSEQMYGQILAPYLQDPKTFVVISSDFCHWGERFQYQPYNKSCGQIWQSIEAMDHEGMALIEAQDNGGFRKYLKQTRNTICGRHPINVLLEMISSCPKPLNIKFVRYAQSSHCKRPSDSSVSYAAAVVCLPAAKSAKARSSREVHPSGAGVGAGAGGVGAGAGGVGAGSPRAT